MRTGQERLWERNHRPERLEIGFWPMAERELKAGRDRKQAQVCVDKVNVCLVARTKAAPSWEVSGEDPHRGTDHAALYSRQIFPEGAMSQVHEQLVAALRAVVAQSPDAHALV